MAKMQALTVENIVGSFFLARPIAKLKPAVIEIAATPPRNKVPAKEQR